MRPFNRPTSTPDMVSNHRRLSSEAIQMILLTRNLRST
jgi:hypothetical protein